MRYQSRRGVRRRDDSSGQVWLFFALGLFLFAVLGVAVVDAGLLLNTRRDSQNDVDKIAVAGALEITLDADSAATDTEQAITSAAHWAEANGLEFDGALALPPTNPTTLALAGGGSLTLEVVDAPTCYPDSGSTLSAVGVRATIAQRSSPTLMAGIVGIDGLVAGATATACAGRPIEAFGVLPFALSMTGLAGQCYVDGEPVFGALCDIRVGSTEQGVIGELSISRSGQEPYDCTEAGSGANELNENIVEGTIVWCQQGDLVHAKPGVNINKTYDGLRHRIGTEGACQALYASNGGTTLQLANAWSHLESYLDGVAADNPAFEGNRMLGVPAAGADDLDGTEDFYEIWEYPGADATNPASALSTYDCDSPRNVVLIVINDFATPEGGDQGSTKRYEVRDFARVYLEGCTRETSGGGVEFREDCNWGQTLNGDLVLHARFVQQVGLTNSTLGLSTSFGQLEVFLKE